MAGIFEDSEVRPLAGFILFFALIILGVPLFIGSAYLIEYLSIEITKGEYMENINLVTLSVSYGIVVITSSIAFWIVRKALGK